MSSIEFFVGVNDGQKHFDKKGKPYEKAHLDDCGVGGRIDRRRREYFTDYQKALCFARDHKLGRCCEPRWGRTQGMQKQ